VVRQPGPLHAFYQRIRARRGHQVAVVAAARKLACLFWCMLTRGQDYAYGQPSLTRNKLRQLELAAGAPRYQGGRSVWSTNKAMRQAERELALQAERAYRRTVADWQSTTGAGATPRRASQTPPKGQQRGKPPIPNPAH
jgi:transposase